MIFTIIYTNSPQGIIFLPKIIEKDKSNVCCLNYSYDSIICVAGGYEGGSVKDKDVFEKFAKLDRMNF